MLSAEIIAIGSELLTPSKTDTNSLWLTERLNEIGIEVKLKTIVGDDSARLEESIRDALTRSDVVLTTGGLGPTEDDITRTVSAKAIDRELVYRDDLEKDLRERFRRWGREMPEINKRQAFVIEECEVLANPNGSAVGMLVCLGEKFFGILPGPPKENQPMFNDFIYPKLREKAGGIVTARKLLRISGMGESAVDEAIAPIYKSYEGVETSILFSRSEIELHLSLRGNSIEAGKRILNELAAEIIEKLGVAVFSTEGETMEEVVGKLLTNARKTVSLAESCTGGLVGHRLTEVSGSSNYFIEGAICYANDAKVKTLGVPSMLIENHGAVSAEVAEAMARGIREKADTDYAVSVTGIAGPSGGTEEKPVGTIFIGFSDRNGERSFKILLPGDRYLIRWRASQAALDYLRRQLLKA